MDLVWHERRFEELTATELYSIVELRERVFVVEQNCVYLDADGADRMSRHVWATRGPRTNDRSPVRSEARIGDSLVRGSPFSEGPTVAYLRIVAPGVKFPETSIGRVAIAPEARGEGLGRELMRRGIAAVGNLPIRISAQAYLEKFYADLGFVRTSETYDEDGIPHLEMLRTSQT